MSKDNTENRKLSREERKKMIVRIVAMIMAILMILGLGVTAVSILLGSRAKAAEPVSVIDTSSLKQSGDVLISVGISYGSIISKQLVSDDLKDQVESLQKRIISGDIKVDSAE